MRYVPPKRRFLKQTHSVKNQTTFLLSVLQLVVNANVVASSLILSTLMIQAMLSSETLVLSTATWCHTPEDDILHSHCRENLKS
jgi:hypothetical protein